MNISVGKTSDDPRKIKKSFSSVASFSGQLKNESSIKNPVILVQGNISSVASCNYMHIPAFDRYYYLSDCVSISNSLFELRGTEDVLMSNANDILQSFAIAKRSSSNYDLYLDDGNFKLKSNPIVVTHAFPNAIPCSASDSCFLLMCTGSAVIQ